MRQVKEILADDLISKLVIIVHGVWLHEDFWDFEKKLALKKLKFISEI